MVLIHVLGCMEEKVSRRNVLLDHLKAFDRWDYSAQAPFYHSSGPSSHLEGDVKNVAMDD